MFSPMQLSNSPLIESFNFIISPLSSFTIKIKRKNIIFPCYTPYKCPFYEIFYFFHNFFPLRDQIIHLIRSLIILVFLFEICSKSLSPFDSSVCCFSPAIKNLLRTFQASSLQLCHRYHHYVFMLHIFQKRQYLSGFWSGELTRIAIFHHHTASLISSVSSSYLKTCQLKISCSGVASSTVCFMTSKSRLGSSISLQSWIATSCMLVGTMKIASV